MDLSCFVLTDCPNCTNATHYNDIAASWLFMGEIGREEAKVMKGLCKYLCWSPFDKRKDGFPPTFSNRQTQKWRKALEIIQANV